MNGVHSVRQPSLTQPPTHNHQTGRLNLASVEIHVIIFHELAFFLYSARKLGWSENWRGVCRWVTEHVTPLSTKVNNTQLHVGNQSLYGYQSSTTYGLWYSKSCQFTRGEQAFSSSSVIILSDYSACLGSVDTETLKIEDTLEQDLTKIQIVYYYWLGEV